VGRRVVEMFPAAMLALTMLVTVGMVAISPPPAFTEETRARAIAEAVFNAQAAAVRHCRTNACPVGDLNIPNGAGRLSGAVRLRRQSDGTIIAYWSGSTSGDGQNSGQTFLRNAVSPEKVSFALQQEARKKGWSTTRIGPAENVAQALGSSQNPSGPLVSLGGINVPRNMPVAAIRG
jgi:hypothetical protein